MFPSKNKTLKNHSWCKKTYLRLSVANRHAAFELLPARFLQRTASAATSRCLPTELGEGHNRGRSSVQESSLWERTGGCQQSLSQPTGRVADLHLSCSCPLSTGMPGSLSPIKVCQVLPFWRPSLVQFAMTNPSKSLGMGEVTALSLSALPCRESSSISQSLQKKSSWMKGSLFKHNQNSTALAGSPGPFCLPASGRVSHLLGTSYIWKYTDLMSEPNLQVFCPLERLSLMSSISISSQGITFLREINKAGIENTFMATSFGLLNTWADSIILCFCC